MSRNHDRWHVGRVFGAFRLSLGHVKTPLARCETCFENPSHPPRSFLIVPLYLNSI